MARRAKHDKAFKLMVVELSLKKENVKDVAAEYGISPQLLSIWRTQYRENKELAFPGNGKKALTDSEKELERIKRELSDVTMERDILKKAITIFSKSDKKNTRL